MKNDTPASFARRRFLRLLAAAGLGGTLWPGFSAAQSRNIVTRTIPSSGETIAVVGLGSWITFNVGADPVARRNVRQIIAEFIRQGGELIDSSPMYGSSQEVIGQALKHLDKTSEVFAADKVWTPFGSDGREQIAESRSKWGVDRFDLMQVHNLVDWREHLPLLFDMKAAGELRYVGITTSHGRRHTEFAQIMREHPLDFVQLSYNIDNRTVEQRLLPLAKERGIAVIVNRPFQEGSLINWAKQKPLPDWASEIDCDNWAQFLLKFIVSHPAVTCAIPATSQLAHLKQNMGAARGRLPDAAMRQRMVEYVQKL